VGREERFKLHRRQVVGAAGGLVDSMHVVLDRFGRQLTTGDIVVHNPANPIAMQIVKLVPSFEPGTPPGLVNVTCVASFNFRVPKGTPLLDLILVDIASEQESDETKRQNVDGEKREDPARDTPPAPGGPGTADLPPTGIVLTDAPPPIKGDDDA
jgi:hypothetical protein